MSSRRLPGPVERISATVEVPSSQSLTNRALVAAAAAGGGEIVRPLDCEDTRLLAEALGKAGWPVRVPIGLMQDAWTSGSYVNNWSNQSTL